MKSKDEILELINSLTINKEDYKVILKLLNELSDEMFTKILEEVIDGNLYWSDFDEILANTNYPDILKNNLEMQNKLLEKIIKITTFRRSIKPDYKLDNKTNYIAIQKAYNEEGKEDNLYTEEYERLKNNLLYDLTKVSSKDNILSIACKTRLYNAIRNGELLLNTDSERLKGIIDNGNYITVGDENFEYINPNDIFLFINDYKIPLEYSDQVLDSFDMLYMDQNNISEEEMKKIKSVSYFLRRKRRIKNANK